MDGNDRRNFEAVLRTHTFMEANAADFPQTSKGGQSALRLTDYIAEIRQLDAAWVSSDNSKRQATAAKHNMRESLRAQVQAISMTNETIALDHPEHKGKFLWSGKSISDQALLAIARADAEDAAPVSARFIEYGLPEDFLVKLNATIGAFEQHIDEQSAAMGVRVTTRNGLKRLIGLAMLELERLNTAVHNKYRDNPTKLAAWESARRVERHRRTTKGQETQNQAGATPPAP